MNSASYEKPQKSSRGHFSTQKFVKLKAIAASTVGINNSIFETELSCLLKLYRSVDEQITVLEKKIIELIEEIHPHYMSIPGMALFQPRSSMLNMEIFQTFLPRHRCLLFAGLEPSINNSGTASYKGHMVKHGSARLRYVLMNCALPLVHSDVTFATYYARKRSEG